MFKCYLQEDGDPRANIDHAGPATAERVREALDGCPASASRTRPSADPGFYDYKAELRAAFPSTMIEIVSAGSFLDRIALVRGPERTVVHAAVNTGP